MVHAHSSSPPVPFSNPPPVRVIIKLGGSAITVKQQHETLKPEVLKSVCGTLKQLYDQVSQEEAGDNKAGFVVVHGAGSFGHFEASQYRVTKPDTPQETLREGFAKTRRSVTRLNHLVVSALIDAGLPSVGLSPYGFCFSHNGGLHPSYETSYINAVNATLSAGLVPVLHGDGILEAAGPPVVDAQGVESAGRYREGQITPAILSGDKIMLCLARHLQPQYAVFLTDVPGVLTKPPGQPGAQLIPQIGVVANTGALRYQLPQQPEMTTAEHDTTGGIAAKVQAAAEIARAAVPVIIAEAGTPGGAAALLHGPGGSSSCSSSKRTVVRCL